MGELLDHPFDEPMACWCGSIEKVKDAHLWQILEYQGLPLTFEIVDGVCEDTSHLLPTEEQMKEMK
jgi:hypothetical protein